MQLTAGSLFELALGGTTVTQDGFGGGGAPNAYGARLYSKQQAGNMCASI